MSDHQEKPVVPPAVDSPRDRALEHMRKLLKATALGGAALGLAACESCSTPMVCDPLPPPMQCQNPTSQDYRQNFRWTARWAQGDAGSPVASVTVTANDYRGTPPKFATAPTFTGATLVSWGATASNTSLEFTCAPDPQANAVVASISFDCDGTPQTFQLRLDSSGTHTVGAQIPVTLVSPP